MQRGLPASFEFDVIGGAHGCVLLYTNGSGTLRKALGQVKAGGAWPRRLWFSAAKPSDGIARTCEENGRQTTVKSPETMVSPLLFSMATNHLSVVLRELEVRLGFLLRAPLTKNCKVIETMKIEWE